MRLCPFKTYSRLALAAAASAAFFHSHPIFAQTRAIGLDFSDYQGGSTNFTNIKNAGNTFLFLRASRGGTTGTWNQSAGSGTGNFRYDDLYWINNVNGAKAVGLYTGAYHYDRADSLSTSDSNATIIARAQQEADHLIQVAGPWIKPGYLRPVLDLEAGSGLSATQLSLFATTFADEVYAAKHVLPICYVNSSYANSEVNSTVATKMPDLWIARPSSSSNHATGDPIPALPTYPNVYGKWNPSYPTIPNPQPWQFWQDGSTSGTGYFGDYDVAHGTVEWVKDFLVPVYWVANSSGDWSTLANWNTNTDPNDAVTAAEDPENQYKINGVLNHNDATRAGKAPAARLPGNITASLTLTGADDTVILDNTVSTAAYTVTLSTGSYNIRKLYIERPFNITGGSLTINYDPTTPAAIGSSTALGSTPFSAEFSNAVSLSGAGSLSVHTLIVDAAQTFTLAGGTLTFNTISLASASAPNAAKILITGDVTLNSLSNAAAVIASSGNSSQAGRVDLNSSTHTLTIGNGTAGIDLDLQAPIFNGSIIKAGAGTLQLSNTATFNAPVTVNGGTLIATQNNQLGTAVVLDSAGSLNLSGNLSYNLPLTIGGGGANGVSTTAPGNPGALHARSGSSTWAGAITLAGTGINGTDPLINQVSAASGATLTLSGVISSPSTGAFAKSDNGDLVLAGSFPNTYTGLSRLYGGRLILEKDGALGTADQGTFMLSGSSSTIAFWSASSLNYTTPEYLFTDGSGASGSGQIDNLGGNTTFAGSIGLSGTGNISSIGVTSGSLTVSGGIYARSSTPAARTLNKVGTGALILTGDSNAAPAFSSASLLTNSTLNVNAGTVDLRSPSPGAANIPGMTSYSVAASASLINTTGTLSNAAITVNGLFSQAAGRLDKSSLILNTGAIAQFNPSASAASVLSSLTINGTGKLDLTSNDLVINYSGASPATTICQNLFAGRNGGAWNGTGIVSSAAAADSQLRTAIGYVEASAMFGLSGPQTASWQGDTVDSTSLLLKYTWYGDANLDGQVTADDYILIDRGLAKNLTGWSNGDFNYDGVVNSADFMLIDRVFGQAQGFSPGFLSERQAQFGDAYVSQLIASTPEPTSLGLAIAGLLLAARRRRATSRP